MDYIPRNHSVLTGKENLEPLYTFKDFPVFMGCTDQESAKDIKADMSFAICKDTGIVQLDKLLPLELVYQSQHNDGVGKIWLEHYQAFAHFLEQFQPQNVLEIGGANDVIARDFLERNPKVSWTVVEPHPLFESDEQITVVKNWFDSSFTYEGPVDTIIHSHVLEHTYEPKEFIEHISSFLKNGGKHIFTFPNMVKMLSQKYTNCLNFEHTAFLAEPFVDGLLRKYGFTILKKEYFQDHSIFYATEKTGTIDSGVVLPDLYTEYKKLFLDFIQYHENLVALLNTKMREHQGEVFLFGAHIFSQYLLEFGLEREKITCILDNSDLKNKKRLYGTTLLVEKPDIIAESSRPAVIVKIGAYRDEVIKQLKELHPEVVIFE